MFAGSKPLDLCNGGMVWSCCVPRARTNGLEEDFSDPGSEYGIVNDPRKFFFGIRFYHIGTFCNYIFTYIRKYVHMLLL